MVKVDPLGQRTKTLYPPWKYLHLLRKTIGQSPPCNEISDSAFQLRRPPPERKSIGVQDISKFHWSTETNDEQGSEFQVESSTLETQNSRPRIPSLRAVEALSATLQPQVDIRALHTCCEKVT